MKAYKIETNITTDGKIILPLEMKDFFNELVEIILLIPERTEPKKRNIEIPIYYCNGKIQDFKREDIYEYRT
jgi:hypothetical protein